MSKVLFFNMPAYGHTNPTLPLVAELVRRGEQVIYYSSEAFQPAIEQAGATFRSIGSYMTDQTPVDENLVRFAYTLMLLTRSIIADILSEVIAEKPDYIIYDSLCVWGKCIAQILRVPAISSMTALLRPSSLFHPAVFALLPSLMSLSLRQMLQGGAEFAKFLAVNRQLQKTYGISGESFNDMYYNPAELNIVYSTKQLQILPARYDASFVFVGPFIEQRSNDPPFPFDELERLGTDPVIYMSLGTVFNNKGDIYRLCIEAFANLKYRVILSVGSKIDIVSLGAIPANFIVKSFVPQLQVLRHADLFITHAGMNSVSEGLYEGVPLLMLPQAADQAFIAARVEQLGAGKMLRTRNVNAMSLRKATEEVLAQRCFQQASATIGESFRQCGGPSLAADTIETLKREHGL